MNLPRQHRPVRITLEGEQADVEHYLRRIKLAIESISHDNVLIQAAEHTPFSASATIYPEAVND